MRIARSDALPIALLSVAVLSIAAANLLLQAPPLHLALVLTGAIAYAALAYLGDYEPYLLCDTIQSGETSVGTLAICSTALFLTANPYLILAVSVAALVLYQLFMKAVLAPVKKEIALSGMAAQLILAVMAILVFSGRTGISLSMAASVFTGYFSVVEVPAVLPAVSLVLAVIIPLVLKALNPEMRLLSQGSHFSRRPPRVRSTAAAGLVIARGLLAAISLLFAGWTCCIGIGMRRLYRGALPDLVMVLSMVLLGQIALLIEILSGPLPAMAVSWACSYAVFFLYYCRRVHVYDRYQQS